MEPEVRERFEKMEGIVASLIQVAVSHEERLDRVTDKLDLVGDKLDRVAERLDRVAERLDRLAEAQARTDEQIKHTQEELDVLVHMVDDWIRRNPRT
ncbi:MAG: hypothetical protein HY238_02200 [Acidobacteria bacterium]|nr:hypothetical protein [Acidobacteriota bacterium]